MELKLIPQDHDKVSESELKPWLGITPEREKELRAVVKNADHVYASKAYRMQAIAKECNTLGECMYLAYIIGRIDAKRQSPSTEMIIAAVVAYIITQGNPEGIRKMKMDGKTNSEIEAMLKKAMKNSEDQTPDAN